MIFHANDVVQFTENHKWCGCLGIIREVKECGDDVKYLIGVPVPLKGIAFIFSMESENEFKYIGKTIMVIGEESD